MEGGVDGDFEVAALGGVGCVGFGEAHYDLGGRGCQRIVEL